MSDCDKHGISFEYHHINEIINTVLGKSTKGFYNFSKLTGISVKLS